jgi:hypothetical protein
MMASGEIRLSTMTMRQMPVLAHSPSGGSTEWGDGTGGFSNAELGVVVSAGGVSVSTSEVASATMDLAGAGAAGMEAQFGERFLGSPNGRLYSRAWANGVGRAYKISSLTKLFGIYGLAAGTAFDAQSLQDGHINGGQFSVNLGLGVLGTFVPLYSIGSLNILFINNFYPGGWQGYSEDYFNPDVLGNPLFGGYDGLR